MIKNTMKSLSRDYQISMQSHSEIVPRLSEVLSRLQGEKVRYIAKQPTYGHIVNGLVLLLLDNTEEEQISLAKQAIERLEDWTLGAASQPGQRGLTAGTPWTQLPKVESEKSAR